MSESQMSADENKLIIQRFWVEVLDGGDLNVADEIFDTDWVLYEDREVGFFDLEASSGPAALKELVGNIRSWFSNLQVTSQDHVAAEADQVVTRFAISATREGIPGVPVDVKGMSISQVYDGKIVGSWLYWESGLMYEQLGYFPAEFGLCRPPWRC